MDAKTRLYQYNGQPFLAIVERSHFPGQRSLKLATKVIEFASRQPLIADLLPCDIGYYPNATKQKDDRPNGHWSYTLIFCLDGAGELSIRGRAFKIVPGMIAVIPPFEAHAYSADPAQPWSYYRIQFNGAMAAQYYNVLTDGGRNLCVSIETDVRFVEMFEQMLTLLHAGDAYKVLVQAASVLHQLLGDLYGRICAFGMAPQSAQARLERTLEVMRNNVNMHVSIQELAAIAGMSHGYFALQFKRHTGMSPRSYFNHLKIAKACEYLSGTDAKVEHIAGLVGYDDPFYFCRLFKRLVGKTPTEYRRAPTGFRLQSSPGADEA